MVLNFFYQAACGCNIQFLLDASIVDEHLDEVSIHARQVAL